MVGILEFFKKRWLFIVIGVLVLCTLLAPYLLTRASFCGVSFDGSGQIGDTIAGTTAPFVGLLSAFLLIYTLYKQLQFNKQQTKLSLDDQFKSSYFQMLDQQRKLVDGIEYNSLTPWPSDGIKVYEAHGNKAFIAYYRILALLFSVFDDDKFDKGLSLDKYEQGLKDVDHAEDIGLPEDDLAKMTKKLKKSVHKWYLNDLFFIKDKTYDFYHSPGMDTRRMIAFVYHLFFFKHRELGRYFRHIYYILTILEREETRQLGIYSDDPEQAMRIKKSFMTYAQFIPAQMTVEELTLMYYNCALFPKLLTLAKRYELFQTLPAYMLINENHQYDSEIILDAKTKRLEDILGPELTDRLVALREHDS